MHFKMHNKAPFRWAPLPPRMSKESSSECSGAMLMLGGIQRAGFDRMHAGCVCIVPTYAWHVQLYTYAYAQKLSDCRGTTHTQMQGRHTQSPCRLQSGGLPLKRTPPTGKITSHQHIKQVRTHHTSCCKHVPALFLAATAVAGDLPRHAGP